VILFLILFFMVNLMKKKIEKLEKELDGLVKKLFDIKQ